jgi:hypothetical protein
MARGTVRDILTLHFGPEDGTSPERVIHYGGFTTYTHTPHKCRWFRCERSGLVYWECGGCHAETSEEPQGEE